MRHPLGTLAFVMILAVAGLFGFRLIHSQIITDLYRDRLLSLGRDYDRLRRSYNEAVRKTAVTELIVQDGRSVSPYKPPTGLSG